MFYRVASMLCFSLLYICVNLCRVFFSSLILKSEFPRNQNSIFSIFSIEYFPCIKVTYVKKLAALKKTKTYYIFFIIMNLLSSVPYYICCISHVFFFFVLQFFCMTNNSADRVHSQYVFLSNTRNNKPK